jgi:hypothetical protein
MSFSVGQTFDNIASAKAAIKTYVGNAGESYKVVYSDKKRFEVGCKNCGFRIRAAESKKHGISITHFVHHTCGPATHFQARNMNSLEFIVPHHRAAILDHPKITARAIQSAERLQYYHQISYKQAYRVKQRVLEELYGNESASFAKFPAYMDQYCDHTNGGYRKSKVSITWELDSSRFQAAFFCPHPLRKATRYLRNFYAIDGTHTKSQYRMMLLICCGIDANDRVLPIAWGLVPIENEEWWTWFLEHLKEAFPASVINSGLTLISDREKGMASAVEQVLPNATHLHCCQHIADNLQQRFGNKVRPFFWRACRAKTDSLYKAEMMKIREVSRSAFDYLCAIDKTLWTRAHRQVPCFGHDTSNIVESINSLWNELRHLPPLHLIHGVYNWCMTTIHDRSKESKAQKFDVICDVPMAKFNDRLHTSRRFRVYPSDEQTCQVEDLESSRKKIVKLGDNNECECLDFQEYQAPCSHAIAAARFFGKDPIQLFAVQYQVDRYINTFSRPFAPVSVNDLASHDQLQPPILKKQAGRPRTKRIRKGTWSRKQTRCSNCLDWGHNKRRCTNQPVSNGRRQRARDWLAHVDNREEQEQEAVDDEEELSEEEQDSGEEESSEEEESGNEEEGSDEEELQRLDRELGITQEDVDQVILGSLFDSDDELSNVDSDPFEEYHFVDLPLEIRYSTRSGKAYGVN